MFGTAASADVTSAVLTLPLAAGAAAALAYRGQKALAGIALAVGAAIATALEPTTAVFAVVAAIAVLAAIVLLPRVSYQFVGGVMIVALALASLGGEALRAAREGLTLPAYFTAQSKLAADAFSRAVDPQVAPELAKQFSTVARETALILPSVYLMASVFATVFVFAAILWVARRADQPVTVPPLEAVDITPWIVLGPVVGLLCLAASKALENPLTARAIGTNLLLATAPILFIQGIGVVASLAKRGGMPTGPRVVTYTLLFLIDAVLHIVSVLGLADLWANFRGLPREGHPDPKLTPVQDDEA